MASEKNDSAQNSGLENMAHNDLNKDSVLPSDGETSGTRVETPEGGTKAWLSLLGGSCAMFVSFGWVNCIAVFQAEYETNQLKQYSQSTVSWITSMEREHPSFARRQSLF